MLRRIRLNGRLDFVWMEHHRKSVNRIITECTCITFTVAGAGVSFCWWFFSWRWY